MPTDQPTATAAFSIRLSPAALALLDAKPEGRSTALRTLVEAAAEGQIPAGAESRGRVQVSARIDRETVARARAAACAHKPPLGLPEVIGALLLEE
ncbi:hypothetical protein B5P43_15635 [Bacillus sp. SRB_336]|nr:hypothetical protein B5P43_15635 [Bacillus sp. SRB_336]